MEPELLSAELEQKIQDKGVRLLGAGKVLLVGDSMLGRFQSYGAGAGLLDPAIFENIAIGGTTTGHWVHILTTNRHELVSHDLMHNFGHVVLMIGTNNLADPNATPKSVSEGVKRVLALLKGRMSPNAKLWFIPILPRFDGLRPNLLEAIEGINDEIRGHSDKVGYLSLLPPTPLLHDPTYYDVDKLHLNTRGYVFLAKLIKETLAPVHGQQL